MTNANKLGLALLLATCLAAGCKDDGDDDHAHGGHEHSDMNDAGEPGLPAVPCPKTTPEFVATPSGGLEVTGTSNRVTAKLIDADWRPPFKGDNEWTIVFRDAAGDPVDDIEFTMLETYMPVHSHPGKKTPQPTKLDDPGTFVFEDVNLFMGGPWEVRFKVTSKAAGGADYLVFNVCVAD